MKNFSLPIQIRWSDIDQNRHLRHSAYYDFGATVRVACFSQQGLTNLKLEELQVGPVLFREEAVFKREIKFEDKITVDIHVTKATEDFSRFSLRHDFYKEDGTHAAVINLDGAWIDLLKRKLVIPNEWIQSIIRDFPRSSDFEWIKKKIV